MVMLHKIVDVHLAVESPVHNQLQFFDFEKIYVLQKIFDCPDIWNVAGKLPVVHRQHGTFPTEHGQIDLRQIIALFVFFVLRLTDQLGTGRNGCCVKGKVFIFGSTFRLSAEVIELMFF